MVSCDAYYISKMIPEISYEDAICSIGLNNGVFDLNYDGNDVYMMKSRYISTPQMLLDSLEIDYQKLEIEELFNPLSDLSKVLVFLPKILLDNLDIIHEDTKQLAISLSTFVPRLTQTGSLELTGMEPTEIEYTVEVTREQLEKLATIEMKPAMDSVFIVRLNGSSISEDKIRENVRESMTACLVDYDGIDNGALVWYGGQYGYKKLTELIKNFSSFDETEKKILMGTMVAGSNFMHRKEYWEALQKRDYLDLQQLNNLRVSGGLWRKVVRTLINHVCYGQEINAEEMSNVLERIASIELEAFSYIKENI